MGYFNHEFLVWGEIIALFGFTVVVAILDTVKWEGCVKDDMEYLTHCGH
jgi:hypothetical protein